jgi:hypothetical protein
MTIPTLFLGQVAALLLLASAMTRHQRDLFGAPLSRRASRGLRWMGAMLMLAQAAWLCRHPCAILWLEVCGTLSAALVVAVILLASVSAVRRRS